MKMSAFADELERQIEDAENYNQLGFEDRLSLLVDSEWNRRQNNKLLRYIRNAHFSDSSATMEGIESAPAIVPVAISRSSSDIRIEKNGLQISLPADISADTLLALVHELC